MYISGEDTEPPTNLTPQALNSHPDTEFDIKTDAGLVEPSVSVEEIRVVTGTRDQTNQFQKLNKINNR